MINTNISIFIARKRAARAVQRLSVLTVTIFLLHSSCKAQPKYIEPRWWFGGAGAANFNSYSGYLQRANEVTYFPSAFHRGHGFGIFGAATIEYRIPHSVFGLMLQQGIDDRKAHFELPDQRFNAHIGYFSVEPSLRLAPFKFPLYFYGGPRFGFLVTSDFTYQKKGNADYPDQTNNPDIKFYISSLRKNPVSTQVGLGYDFKFLKNGRDRLTVSPFATYYPTMWHKNIRTIERLYLSTIRAGVAIKYGRARVKMPVVLPPQPPVKLSDRDGDSIFDLDDKCPDTFGLVKYQGCPIPDTDGDGINDEEDKCPTVKGLVRYGGCPIPDTDGDGVNDEEDKCPTRPGPASNRGCPVIAKDVIDKVNFAAKNVFFATGSYILLPKSYASLNAVAALMRDDSSLQIDIDGHTDSQGSDESNRVLSDNRAAAVKNFLISKGISSARLKSTGYGETRPVADNKTAAGRAQNRRTEMTVRNF